MGRRIDDSMEGCCSKKYSSAKHAMLHKATAESYQNAPSHYYRIIRSSPSEPSNKAEVLIIADYFRNLKQRKAKYK